MNLVRRALSQTITATTTLTKAYPRRAGLIASSSLAAMGAIVSIGIRYQHQPQERKALGRRVRAEADRIRDLRFDVSGRQCPPSCLRTLDDLAKALEGKNALDAARTPGVMDTLGQFLWKDIAEAKRQESATAPVWGDPFPIRDAERIAQLLSPGQSPGNRGLARAFAALAIAGLVGMVLSGALIIKHRANRNIGTH